MEEEKLTWKKMERKNELGESIASILNALLLVIEAEKKKTLEQLEKAKKKLSSYPSQARRYAKKHMDKVFTLLEKNGA